MMNHEIEVNDILNEFLSDFETSGEEALKRYSEEYPDLMKELHERAGYVRMFSLLPEPDLTTEQETSLNLRASSVVQNLIHKLKPEPVSGSDEVGETESASFGSLADRLGELGETFESAAAKLRVSDLIVNKLDKRRIRAETVPRLLYEKLAFILATSYEDVYRYATRAPVASSGHFKASSAPIVHQQAEFAELVRWDPDMDGGDKDFWLALSPSDKGGSHDNP